MPIVDPDPAGIGTYLASAVVLALARLRGLEGFSSARSLSINELAEKVFTTAVSWTSRR
jgi:hypothetical protein